MSMRLLCSGVVGWLMLVCGASVVSAQTVVRGPYLQMGTPTSMTVVWRTKEPTKGQVWLGTEQAALTQTFTDDKERTQHEVTVTGLKPATRYYYKVGTPAKALAGGDAQHFFVTAPPVGQASAFRFWVVGDSGTGSGLQTLVRDAAMEATGKLMPALFLHMGDMAYGSGTEDEFQKNFFDIYTAQLRQMVCWPTMGNHEGKSSKSGPQTGPYYDAYVLPKNAQAGGVASGTEAYYSFDYANVHFIVLDSHDSPRTSDGAMATWLKNDLAATKQPWIIAYWHHPPYTKGSHDSDTEGQLIQMREVMLPILEAGGVDLVLGGHSHTYERSYLLHGAYKTPTPAKEGIIDNGDGKLDGSGAYRKKTGETKGAVYVVAGHGGTLCQQEGKHPLMFISEPVNGSCLVDVDGNTLRLINIKLNGQQSDNFTLVKGESFVLSSPNGGEEYKGGQTVEIRWATVGTSPKVNLDLSLDGGKQWQSIAKQIENTGRYEWKIPAVTSAAAMLRASNPDKPSMHDKSNFAFSIQTPGVLPASEQTPNTEQPPTDGGPTTEQPPNTGCKCSSASLPTHSTLAILLLLFCLRRPGRQTFLPPAARGLGPLDPQ